MKIIVTGANSLIGNNIVSTLIKNGHNVVGIDIAFRTKHQNEKQVLIKDYSEYPSKMENADVLIHLAWMGTTQDQRISEEVQKKDYEISLMMAEKAFNEYGIKRFILAGSQAEYGPHNDLITEDTELKPNIAYGKYKHKLYETLANKYPNKVVIDGRIFSCYGPHQALTNLIPATLTKMLKNETCQFTPATQLWNFIYVEDLANIFAKLCVVDTKSTCVNLASDDTRPLKEMISDMKEVSKSVSDLQFGAVPYNTSGYVSLNPSIKKLKSLIPDVKFTPFKAGVINVIKQIKGELL